VFDRFDPCVWPIWPVCLTNLTFVFDRFDPCVWPIGRVHSKKLPGEGAWLKQYFSSFWSQQTSLIFQTCPKLVTIQYLLAVQCQVRHPFGSGVLLSVLKGPSWRSIFYGGGVVEVWGRLQSWRDTVGFVGAVERVRWRERTWLCCHGGNKTNHEPWRDVRPRVLISQYIHRGAQLLNHHRFPQ